MTLGNQTPLSPLGICLRIRPESTLAEELEARIIAGTTTRRDVEWLVESIETLAAEKAQLSTLLVDAEPFLLRLREFYLAQGTALRVRDINEWLARLIALCGEDRAGERSPP